MNYDDDDKMIFPILSFFKNDEGQETVKSIPLLLPFHSFHTMLSLFILFHPLPRSPVYLRIRIIPSSSSRTNHPLSFYIYIHTYYSLSFYIHIFIHIILSLSIYIYIQTILSLSIYIYIQTILSLSIYIYTYISFSHSIYTYISFPLSMNTYTFIPSLTDLLSIIMAAGRMGQMDRAFATFQEFSGICNFTALFLFHSIHFSFDFATLVVPYSASFCHPFFIFPLPHTHLFFYYRSIFFLSSFSRYSFFVVFSKLSNYLFFHILVLSHSLCILNFVLSSFTAVRLLPFTFLPYSSF